MRMPYSQQFYSYPLNNARFLDTHRQGSFPHPDLHRNAVQQSASSWWVTRKFVDSVLRPALSPGPAHDARHGNQRCQALERVLAHAEQAIHSTTVSFQKYPLKSFIP